MAGGDLVAIDLTPDDLLAINNALNEVCNGAHRIPDWEFHTLMGVERSEAQATLQKICAVVPRSAS